jgi:hypothetical protein
MRLQSNKQIRKWLTLLFAVSLLANAQASYACAMMPDMSEQNVECCCGVTHRSTVPTDFVSEQATADLTSNHHEQDPSCDDPRVGCCMLEMSVGINDPPSSDELLTLSSIKIDQHKTFKQLDDSPEVLEVVYFETQVENVKGHLATVFYAPYLHNPAPALYKTTERYRI